MLCMLSLPADTGKRTLEVGIYLPIANGYNCKGTAYPRLSFFFQIDIKVQDLLVTAMKKKKKKTLTDSNEIKIIIIFALLLLAVCAMFSWHDV